MATVTRENIGQLHDKLTVKVSKDDYLPSFDKKLKEYSKTANIPGFRKGMVPAGMIKKMYGASIFTDEILKAVEKELYSWLNTEKPEIFGQPLPLDGAPDLGVCEPLQPLAQRDDRWHYVERLAPLAKLDDGFVDLIPRDANRITVDNSRKADDRHFRRTAADVDDHVAARFGDGKTDAYCCSHRLFDEVNLPGSG